MDIQDRIEALAKAFEARCQERTRRKYPNITTMPTVRTTYGKKYARIVRDDSVSAFVDMTTGAIYYPAGWKGPAKHVRGSVLADDFGLSAFGDFSVKTLR